MLIQGDAIRIPLADESVQCVVISPPYWGLRDYGVAPRVWGGREDCEHEWGELMVQAAAGYDSGEKARWNHRENGRGEAQERILAKEPGWTRKAIGQGSFCQFCGAWRGSLGLEPTPELYVEHIVSVFREVRRVLRKDGICWLNLGDSYAGSWGNYHPNSPPGKHGQRLKETARWNRPAYSSQEFLPPTANTPGLKPKDLVGIPWRVAFALQAYGWWLRSDIIWSKPNPMPESVTDRPTRSHEYVFLLAKNERYYFDQVAVKELASEDTHARYARGRSDTHKWADGGPGNQTIAKTFEHMRQPGVHAKAAPAGSGIKQNESFSAAVKDIVGTRNIRSVWTIATQPYSDAHFATFPEDLVKPCILAGTSHKGCCPKCGAPWDRVVEKSGGTIGKGWHNHDADKEKGQRLIDQDASHGRNGKDPYRISDLGWKPGCECYGLEIIADQPTKPADKKNLTQWENDIAIWWAKWAMLKLLYDSCQTRACIVFDPFAGSGTTVKVAQDLGRIGIGLDLKPDYLRMAKRRTAQQGFGMMFVEAP